MEFEDKIRELAQDGIWWSDDNFDKFLFVGKKLLEKGFTEDEAIVLLQTLYSAIMDEFGC